MSDLWPAQAESVAPTAVGNEVLALADWRRAVAELYAAARREPDPQRGHELWRLGRDELFMRHPQSPLTSDDSRRATGLRYYPYDPALRFTAELRPGAGPHTLRPDTSDGHVRLSRVGHVSIAELDVDLGVWWLAHYGGGLFVPVRDGTAGSETYGGGRYLLDTIKGADLGQQDDRLVIDFNFLYHPSCFYNSAWVCPLAPEENSTPVPIRAGERL